ncbi:Gfo/Idh/MocA family oxidoreductase [Desertivirga brevis]|uniref:Gfo/Idh/MocA family oxidoreductase n=1 Tax=Desertivirga brevis TaxID=2810310 RepID=UPI001A963C27|nr:Gfo/Idh/MocA family oxidoreductase [Pedobacter sp. SYSU D00873]
MERPIVTGILSYGMSGRVFHAPFIHTSDRFELRAVAERSKKKAAERYADIKSYNSVEELLADPEIEMVIVNTPNHLHFDHARLALNAGKHVLVEKPFTATSDQAKELFELARVKDCKVMVYQNRRWDSDFQSVKTVIEQGKLGNLIEVHFRFDRYRKEISPKYFKEEPLPASGLSYDLGPHLLDQVISLFGKPESFVKNTGVYRPESRVDDFFHFHLKYPAGLNVFVTGNLQVVSPLPSFVLHGSKGSFVKKRTDVQEAQLERSILPTDPNYGFEPNGSEGILTTLKPDGTPATQYNTALKGNYVRLFEAVYNYVRLDVPYPIKENEIIWQLELLESK